jgi:hypothetical protein
MSAHGNGDSSESAKPIRRLGDVTWRRFVTSLWWPAKARRWRKGFLLGVALTVLIVGLTVLAISGRADRACSGRISAVVWSSISSSRAASRLTRPAPPDR